MSFFKKLFSNDYRRAVALEGAGQYREAAERYLLAGEPLGVARMHRLLARDAADPWARVDAIRKARDFVPAEGVEHALLRQALDGELADALVSLVEHSGVMDRRDRGLLEEAVTLYQALGRHLAAGETLVKLGFMNRAAEAFKAAGEIGRMEEMFRRADREDLSEAAFERAWDAYEFARTVGDRLGMVEAIARCAELRPADAGLSALLSEHRQKMPVSGRLTLSGAGGTFMILGGKSVVMGRESECGVMLLETGVSRRHARLELSGGQVWLVDLGSTHGTFVDDQPVKRVELERDGEVRLGKQTRLRVRLGERGEPRPASLEVSGGALKGQRFVWTDELLTSGIPPEEPEWLPAGLKLSFLRGYWHAVPDQSMATLRLEGEQLASPTLLQLGDELEVDGVALRVQ